MWVSSCALANGLLVFRPTIIATSSKKAIGVLSICASGVPGRGTGRTSRFMSSPSTKQSKTPTISATSARPSLLRPNPGDVTVPHWDTVFAQSCGEKMRESIWGRDASLYNFKGPAHPEEDIGNDVAESTDSTEAAGSHVEGKPGLEEGSWVSRQHWSYQQSC